MKKSLFFVLLIFAISSYAQVDNSRSDVTFGPVLATSKTTLDNFIELVAYDDDGYLLLSSDKNDFVFDQLDRNLNPVTAKRLPRPEFKGNTLYLNSTSSNGEDLLFTFSYEDKREDKVYLLAQRVNLKDLDYTGELEVLEENTYEKRKFASAYTTIGSPESSKFLVYTSHADEKGSPEQYSLRVFGDRMKEIWQRDIEMPYPNEKFAILDHKLDEAGNVFMIGRYFEKSWKEAKKDEVVPYSYHIIGVFDNGNVIRDYEIEVGDKYIRNMGMTIDENGDILGAGVYANNASAGVKGIFFVRIDRSTKKVVIQSTKELDYEFLTEELTDKQKAKLEKKDKAEDFGINNFVLREMVLHPDGSITMSGEPFYTYETCTTDSRGNRTCVTHFVYGDIFTIKVDKEGNILWTKRIQKYQHTTGGSSLSSYIMLPYNNMQYFLFNDNPKNMVPPKPGAPPAKKRATYTGKAIATYVAEVNDEGMIRQGELFKHEKKAPYFVPRSSESLNDRVLLYLRRGKAIQFCVVTPK